MMKTMIMIIAVAVAVAAETVDEKHARVLQSNTETKDYASMRGYEACNHDELTERDCLAIGCCQWTTIERAGNSTHHCATAVNDGAFCLPSTETPSSAPTVLDDYDYVIDFDPYDDDDFNYDDWTPYADDDYDYDFDPYDYNFFDRAFFDGGVLPTMVIIFVVAAGFAALLCILYKRTNGTIHNNTPPPAPIPGSERAQVAAAVAAATAIPSTTNTQGTTTALQKLSKEQRIQLYNIVFDTNGNQLTLESKHIFMKSITTNTTTGTDAEEYIDIDIGPDYDPDDDNNKMFEGSFYLGVDSARFDSIAEEDDGNNAEVGSLERGGLGGQRRPRSSAIPHGGGGIASERSRRSITHTDGSVHTIVSVRNTQNICISSERGQDTMSKVSNSIQGSTNSSTSSNQNMVPGMCIICFDEFITGDVIVWSDNKHCEHFYHKECLVPYLAHNAQPKTYSTLNVNNNPCPTCRQNYCTVPTTILDTFIRNNDNDAPATSGGGGNGRDRWGLQDNTTTTTTPVVATTSATTPIVTDAAELLDIPAVTYRPVAPYSNRVY